MTRTALHVDRHPRGVARSAEPNPPPGGRAASSTPVLPTAVPTHTAIALPCPSKATRGAKPLAPSGDTRSGVLAKTPPTGRKTPSITCAPPARCPDLEVIGSGFLPSSLRLVPDWFVLGAL